MATEAPAVAPGTALIKMLSKDARTGIGGAGPVNTILGTVAKDAWKLGETALVARYIETAVALDLNPLLNEIWLVNMKGRNGGAGSLAMVVGRDGYLKCARRQPDFRSVVGGAVYENDEFEAVFDSDDEQGWKVRHTPFFGSQEARGAPLGGWALLLRDGVPNAYFWAPVTQYAKNAETSAWSYMDAMMVKCAISYVLRTTYGIAGPVPIDETTGVLEMPPEGGEAPPVADSMDERVADLFARARDVDETRFPEGLIRARTTGASDEQVQAVVEELSAWLEENEPTDADVVDEPASDSRTSDEEPESEVSDAAPLTEEEALRRLTDERYEADPEWAEIVDKLFAQALSIQRELLSAQNEATERGARTRLEVVQGKLANLIPEGWAPGRTAE